MVNRAPPRAVAIVSSIRSTSTSPPTIKASLPTTGSTGTAGGIDGAAGSSLRMLLNAGQVVDAAKEGKDDVPMPAVRRS